MGLQTNNERRTNKIFLHINRDGKIERRLADGTVQAYDAVEGRLTAIYRIPRDFNGERRMYWGFDLEDGEETYTLTLNENASMLGSVARSLSFDIDSIDIVKFVPYKNGRFTNISVYNNGTRLNWRDIQLPAPRDVMMSDGSIVKDYSERKLIYAQLLQVVQQELSKRKQPQKSGGVMQGDFPFQQ